MTHVHTYSLSFAALALLAVLLIAPSLTFAQVEKVSAFVCPVITSEAVGEHNPKAAPIGQDNYTIVPPISANDGELMVPITATNGDGAGVPPGPHSEPGDTDYTAIWAAQ